MKKKRFLSLILMLVMLVSTLVMSGCGTEKKSGNEGNMMENLYTTIQWNYSMPSCSL